jgi:DNA-binding NtrC family response regulator
MKSRIAGRLTSKTPRFSRKKLLSSRAQKKTATDARLIFATNRNLAEGWRREDFAKTCTIGLTWSIVIPSLAARPKDIPPLVKYFVENSRYAATANHAQIEAER